MKAQTISADEVKAAIEAALPRCRAAILSNGSPSGQNSLIIDPDHAVEIATFLRDDPELRLDFCSDVAGVDWLDSELSEKVKVKKLVDGTEMEIEEVRKSKIPGYLEAVYHLYSIEKKHGPIIIRMRTGDRADDVHLPSLTPVWRSAEFQEREIFDLYGIIFDGHPDLRRLLMWDEFTDHPMRKDYVPPSDEDEDQDEPALAGGAAERSGE